MHDRVEAQPSWWKRHNLITVLESTDGFTNAIVEIGFTDFLYFELEIRVRVIWLRILVYYIAGI